MMRRRESSVSTICEKNKRTQKPERSRARITVATTALTSALVTITGICLLSIFNLLLSGHRRYLSATSEPVDQHRRLYICGYGQENLPLLFPQHTVTSLPSDPNTLLNVDSTASSFDILLVDGGSYKPMCEGRWANDVDFFEWSLQFPGKIVAINGESKEMWYSRDNRPGTDKQTNLFRLGYYPTGLRTMRFTFCQQTLLKFGPTAWKAIMDPKHKPKSTKEKFAVFATSNCKRFRRLAAETLAKLGVVENAGRCFPDLQNNQTGNIQNAPEEVRAADWEHNYQHFGAYRFCLTMENTQMQGYVTEKILNAFLAGCIPVYYGSRRDVLAMFNEQAFIYYDINDPAPALERISELEANADAYAVVMAQPILANGSKTIKDFFSFTPGLESGQLIRQIHDMVGVSIQF